MRGRARKGWTRLGLPACAMLAAAGLACSGAPRLVRSTRPAVVHDGRYAMGTVLELTLVARSSADARAVAAEVFARVEALEAELSTWRPESAISRLNAAAGEPPRAVPPVVARVLREAVRSSRLTHGAFDVTIGPLVDLWQQAAERDRLPDAAAIEAARRHVGPDRIRVLEDGRVALAPHSRIDLGGLAKGFALDRVEALLRERPIQAALVSFGQSSLLALGRPPGQPAWRVLLRGADEEPAGVLQLEGRAQLSVSGSLGQWTEIEGHRFGHVIDPRSGRPLEHAAMAAVLAPSGALAEALSKALLVLDGDEALALLESLPEVEGLRIPEDGPWRETSGFRAASQFAPLPAPEGAGEGTPGGAPSGDAEPATP